MNPFLDLLKALGVRGVIAAVLAVALAVTGFVAYDRGHAIKDLENQVKTEKSNVKERDLLIEQQNTAVQALKQAADAAEARASEALTKAKKEAKRNQGLENAVLSRKPRGVDDCSSAVDLINEAVRNAKEGNT